MSRIFWWVHCRTNRPHNHPHTHCHHLEQTDHLDIPPSRHPFPILPDCTWHRRFQQCRVRCTNLSGYLHTGEQHMSYCRFRPILYRWQHNSCLDIAQHRTDSLGQHTDIGFPDTLSSICLCGCQQKLLGGIPWHQRTVYWRDRHIKLKVFWSNSNLQHTVCHSGNHAPQSSESMSIRIFWCGCHRRVPKELSSYSLGRSRHTCMSMGHRSI